jgi:hypothetical protein
VDIMDKMRQAVTDFVSTFVWREAQEELFSTKSGWNIQAGLKSVKKAVWHRFCSRHMQKAGYASALGVPKKEKEC